MYWRLPGGKSAVKTSPWAHAFIYDMDGEVWPEVEEMLNLLNKSPNGTHVEGGYEVSVSPDGRFLNRRRLKG